MRKTRLAMFSAVVLEMNDHICAIWRNIRRINFLREMDEVLKRIEDRNQDREGEEWKQ